MNTSCPREPSETRLPGVVGHTSAAVGGAPGPCVGWREVRRLLEPLRTTEILVRTGGGPSSSCVSPGSAEPDTAADSERWVPHAPQSAARQRTASCARSTCELGLAAPGHASRKCRDDIGAVHHRQPRCFSSFEPWTAARFSSNSIRFPRPPRRLRSFSSSTLPWPR